MLLALGAALLLAFAIPLPAFASARRFCSVHDAAALAATYGSVSAVTFLTACASLDRQGAPYGGHMVAAMALMESPGIIVAVLLLGSLLIGALCGERGMKAMSPLCKDLFPGVLVFFLLDLGVLAGGRMRELRQRARFIVPFAWLLRLPPGDATLLATLAASASYIAVPAAMRLSVPEAEPSLYVGAALGITFPFNILLGLPLYEAAATALLGG